LLPPDLREASGGRAADCTLALAGSARESAASMKK